MQMDTHSGVFFFKVLEYHYGLPNYLTYLDL